MGLDLYNMKIFHNGDDPKTTCGIKYDGLA